jgi:RHS repeat-associated protein
VETVTGPDEKATSFTYDANGRRTATTDADGNVTRFEYDAKGQVIKIIDAQGNVTRYEYDAKGNRIKVIDANGRVTTFAYNFEGQMVSMTDALGYTTTFAYGGSAGCSSCGGGVDKLSSLTDAKGQATLFKYDPLGRLIKETDPLGNMTEYGYDAAGRVIGKTDPNGHTLHYDYDTLGRLTAKGYPDGTQTTFSYDAKGNLLSAANASIAYTFSYDASDRLTIVADSFGHQLDYTYDAAGKRTQMNSSSGLEIAYAYDDAGRLAQIDSPAGNFTFGYDTLGRRDTLNFPNGVTTIYDYDDLGRLTALVSAKTSTLIAENHYTHDQVGNRLSNRDARATASYGYDAIYRLTEAVSNAPGFSGNTKNSGKGTANATQNQKEIYVYDPVGNRLRTDKVKSYSHNAGNELLSADGTSYEYDANGNRTSKINSSGTTTYTWDAENRLTQVTLPDSKTVTYNYDPFGRRVNKTVDGITTRYTYDSEDILFETANGSIGNVYVHGPGIDDPLALLDNKGPAYYHADGLGSIVALTDSTAKVVQRYEYDSFGNRKDMQNTIKQPYTYTGREHDRETGLYYYRARYYDAEAGVFLSKDPLVFEGGSYNLYEYVLNNPVMNTDPTGEKISVYTRSLDFGFNTGPYVHCVLVVTDCNGNKQTWDFQGDNDIYKPAKQPNLKVYN